MKKFIVYLLITFLSMNSYAACEAEKEARDRAQIIMSTWSDASATVAIAGMIVGALLLGPFGGLCGAAGLAPGAGAYIAVRKLEFKEFQLKKCEENHEDYLKKQEEIEYQKVIQAQSKVAGKLIGRIFTRTIEACQQRCLIDLDELLETYILSDRDLADPTVQQEMNRAAEVIRKKYF